MGIDRKSNIDKCLKVRISPDKMTALLELVFIDNSFEYTYEDLIDLLERNGVYFGIQQGTLMKLIEHKEAFLNTGVTAAIGVAPEEGKAGFVINRFEVDPSARKPQVLEDGTVDFKEMTTILNIRRGEQIAERVLAGEGKAGKTVTGELIAAKTGKEARFKVGKNVMVDPEQRFMFASIDGVIVRTDGEKINVFPLYEVNGDIDFNIGNIDFVGSVLVRGNVRSGFRVKASGDIRVTGGVEGAELYADGSIEVSGGILGQNKGIIIAGKNVKSSFIQDGKVEAGEDVLISQSIMHSSIRAGHSVICKSAKGLIVGGTIQAGERVEARTVGNSVATYTAIEVGIPPERRNELLALRSQLKMSMENLKKTEQAVAILDQLAAAGQLSMDKLTMRTNLSHTKKVTADEIVGIRERILELEVLFEQTGVAVIDIAATIYGGCKIVMGRYTKFIKDPINRARFQVVDGDIALLASR
ncbi:MAG: DUF342 domain-containing protein [Gorillibacterium sp.]|nr:DUF342 domain-containing protein [Gorillibacterium sp.]